MGTEYQIHFAFCTPRADLERQLAALVSFASFDASTKTYAYRVVASAHTDMPDAWVNVNERGLYVCDNHGQPIDALFGSLVRLAIAASDGGRVVVEEL